MRSRVSRFCLGLLLCLAFTGHMARADTATISSSGITSAGFDLACLDYQVVGGCLWMTCELLVCEFDYSIRVSHRIPEAVVNAYPILGQSPWPESQGAVAPTAFAQEGGASDEGGATHREQALKFKNTEVFGSPSTLAYHALAAGGGAFPLCRPLTWPMAPYYISTLDPNWRDPVVETPWTMANLLTGVSAGSSRFAGLFPRIGFVKQGHDYKASLVGAKRAAHFVRQHWQPHVYTPLDAGYTPAQGQWPPGQNTDYLWQQLVPDVMSCRALPDINDTASLTDPYRGRVNSVNGNAWQLWRPYACCEQVGATLIFYF
ncbi:MAG: TIGR03756 family integrating conjugative element protein [Halioglobus sp.]|nr:TIGR03756 family integrating conjugative element protein [Halioglobus sp.]